MAAYGMPEEQIASTIGPKGIDPKTIDETNQPLCL
jgi:hypothetical protein